VHLFEIENEVTADGRQFDRLFRDGDTFTIGTLQGRVMSTPGPTNSAVAADPRLFMCHDYQPGGREPRWQTTVRDQRRDNVMVKDGVSEDEFVRMRTARDATLEAPALILPSLQVNIRGGRLPPLSANGIRYLKLPLNQLGRSEAS
jgi:hypothetical protein